MQIPAGAAPGHGAPPAVAREDRIAMRWLPEPFRRHMLEEGFEPLPVRLPGTAKGEDRGLEERHDRGGRRERERHLWPLVLIARTHLLFGLVERRVRRGRRHGLARHAARERPLDLALCQAPMISNLI